MYNIIISPEALDEIQQSTSWYNLQQKSLGNRFFKNVKDCIKKIKKNPLAFQIRYNNFRGAIVSKFPFIVIYFIDNDNKIIVVTAVFHTSRNPDSLNEKSFY